MAQSRRQFMANTLALGCSAAASPLITPVTMASVPGDNRLVVILLRGGMDGLDVVRPVGDPDYAILRADMEQEGQQDLNGHFALHPHLASLMPLWHGGDLAFAHAVSTPYRDKRSHFDGQDLLEAGFGSLEAYQQSGRSGWLNRLLRSVPGAVSETAFAVGDEDLQILHGDLPYASWSPGRSLVMSSQGQLLLEKLYEDDPLFHASAQTAIELSQGEMAVPGDGPKDMMAENIASAKSAGRAETLARFTAERLVQNTRIATFSIGGWDTHRSQKGSMKRALRELSRAILTLKQGLGPHWDKTAILCMTEFGRTARMNGAGGTDHGTGGAMILAGGAVRGQNVFTDWPGLGNGQLYRGRDLMPTADVRNYAGAALEELFGVNAGVLEGQVFPGLDYAIRPRIIL